MVRTRAVVAVVYTGDDGCCDDGEGVYFQGWVYVHAYIYQGVCASEEMVVE